MKCFSKFQLKMASFIETARVRTTFPSFVNVAHIAKISCITWCIFSQLRVTSRFAVSSFCMDQARLIGLYTDLLCANYLHRQKRNILVALMSFIFLLSYFTLSFSCCFFARASCSQNNLLSMTQYLSPVFKSRLQVVQTKQVSWYTFWPARKTMALAGICLAQAVHTLYNLQEFHRAMWVFTVCFCFLFFMFRGPLGAKICTDIYLQTLSVLRSEQFSAGTHLFHSGRNPAENLFWGAPSLGVPVFGRNLTSVANITALKGFVFKLIRFWVQIQKFGTFSIQYYGSFSE